MEETITTIQEVKESGQSAVLDSFTKPYYQMTAIDSLIVGGLILLVIVGSVYLWEQTKKASARMKSR